MFEKFFQDLKKEILIKENYFGTSLLDFYYSEILKSLEKNQIQNDLPKILNWKEDIYEPESFMKYKVNRVFEILEKKYIIDAIAYMDDDLDYYSNGVIFLKLRTKGLVFNIEIEIESGKLNYEVPDFFLKDFQFS